MNGPDVSGSPAPSLPDPCSAPCPHRRPPRVLAWLLVACAFATVLRSPAIPSPAGAVDTTFDAFRRHARSAPLRAEIQALARRALEASVCRGEVPEARRPRDPLLRRPAGVFVTLVRQGCVRGCMGALDPVEATAGDDIIRATVLAATEDRRYAPIRPSEVGGLDILVSIVGPRRQVEGIGPLPASPRAVHPGSRKGGRAAARRGAVPRRPARRVPPEGGRSGLCPRDHAGVSHRRLRSPGGGKNLSLRYRTG